MATTSPKNPTPRKLRGAQEKNKKTEVMVRVFETGKTEKASLPAHFAIEASPILLAQVIHTYTKRMRVRRAHSKDRAEVRGGGKKPWAQKGTGRARASSIRSPLWVGGGITFGPRSRKTRVVPSSVSERYTALRGAIATHVTASTLELVRFPKELTLKTKEFVRSILEPHGLLLIVADGQGSALRAGRNVPGLRVIAVSTVVVTDILKARRLWIDEAAVPAIEKRTGMHQIKRPHAANPTPQGSAGRRASRGAE